MNRTDPTRGPGDNDDPFRKELHRYDYTNRAHEPGYANARNERFDEDYSGPMLNRGQRDPYSFLGPMEDVLDHGHTPHLMPGSHPVHVPPELSRALDENPEAMRHFRRLSSLRQRQIISTLGHGDTGDRRREQVRGIVQKLAIESRKDSELGKE